MTRSLAQWNRLVKTRVAAKHTLGPHWTLSYHESGVVSQATFLLGIRVDETGGNDDISRPGLPALTYVVANSYHSGREYQSGHYRR
jgi:hypothetical protein